MEKFRQSNTGFAIQKDGVARATALRKSPTIRKSAREESPFHAQEDPGPPYIVKSEPAVYIPPLAVEPRNLPKRTYRDSPDGGFQGNGNTGTSEKPPKKSRTDDETLGGALSVCYSPTVSREWGQLSHLCQWTESETSP